MLHFHIDYLHYPLSRRAAWPNVTTLHGRLDIPDLEPLYDEFQDMPVVSISDDQRAAAAQRQLDRNGAPRLAARSLPVQRRPGQYSCFWAGFRRRSASIGRSRSPAASVCRSGSPPRSTTPTVSTSRRRFARSFHLPYVEYLGEITEHEKQELLGGATALLFPIDWSEPFGLVMIESMACGTPVVAWRRGSVPEVLTEGVSGFLVDSMDDAVAATRRAINLSRARCRDGLRAAFHGRPYGARLRGDLRGHCRILDRRRHDIGRSGSVTWPRTWFIPPSSTLSPAISIRSTSALRPRSPTTGTSSSNRATRSSSSIAVGTSGPWALRRTGCITGARAFSRGWR